MTKNNLSKGKFVVFEGGEACGKSTQIKILAKSFKDKNILVTKEPGGTDVADEIRKIITTGDKDKILPETELALVYASRFEHLHKVILPGIEEGRLVVSDRFALSSFVYQGVARGLSKELIQSFNNIFLQNFTPDLTLVFDLDVKVSRSRVGARNNTNERFEQFDQDFHEKIRSGFLEYAKNDSKTVIIDASKSMAEVGEQVKKAIEGLYSN